jgi:hypothetical protein
LVVELIHGLLAQLRTIIFIPYTFKHISVVSQPWIEK